MEQSLLRDIIQWDVKTWSHALFFWDKRVDWKRVNNCLELGSNQGGLSLWLALKNKQVKCTDLTGVQLNASELHTKHKVTSNVLYADLDATAIGETEKYDIIIFKSILGGIGRDNQYNLQEQTIQSAYQALKPGGYLLFAENLKGSLFHHLFRKWFVKWGSSWRYVTLAEMRTLLSAFSKVEIHTTGFAATFGRSESQRHLLASCDAVFFNHITLSSMKYMVYGVAIK